MTTNNKSLVASNMVAEFIADQIKINYLKNIFELNLIRFGVIRRVQQLAGSKDVDVINTILDNSIKILLQKYHRGISMKKPNSLIMRELGRGKPNPNQFLVIQIQNIERKENIIKLRTLTNK